MGKLNSGNPLMEFITCVATLPLSLSHGNADGLVPHERDCVSCIHPFIVAHCTWPHFYTLVSGPGGK